MELRTVLGDDHHGQMIRRKLAAFVVDVDAGQARLLPGIRTPSAFTGVDAVAGERTKLTMADLKTISAAMGISLSATQLAQFETYYQTLHNWNQRINLTRITGRSEVFIKHFSDALSCLVAVPDLPQTVIDVGAGPGLPGLALKIAQPHINLTLVEATGKKVNFLNHLVQKLALQNVTILHDRAETVGQDAAHRQHYQLAVARAVAPLPVLVEYLLPLLQIDGLMVAQKGSAPTPEIASAGKAIHILGGRYLKTMPITLSDLHATRNLILVQKVNPTPKKYPRRPGIPTKKPLV